MEGMHWLLVGFDCQSDLWTYDVNNVAHESDFKIGNV